MARSTNPAFLALFVIALLLTCPFFTCTGWFFLDGIVTYPNQRERALEYERLQREHRADWQQRWDQTAMARGWPAEPPEMKTETDILTQYILGSVCGLFTIGAVLAAAVFGWLTWRSEQASAT